MPRRHVVYRPSPKDITEYLADLRLELEPARGTGETVAYHPACSLQHGQQVRDLPKK
jgi:glycolate oxidase iron-sulfur subunit